jgi:hypothetical protein
MLRDRTISASSRCSASRGGGSTVGRHAVPPFMCVLPRSNPGTFPPDALMHQKTSPVESQQHQSE